MKHKLISGSSELNKRGPKPSLSTSEIMTILVMFQHSKFRNFKNFYERFVHTYWSTHFPKLPSYSRFVTLIKNALVPLTLYAQINRGKKTKIYYIDSSCLPVCNIKRSKRHKTFDDIADYGRTSVGWFFGLKLHLIINDTGQLIAFKITSGNIHDTKGAQPMLEKLTGLAFGDKGYIGKKLFDNLLSKGLKLITRKRKNMKKEKLSDYEQQLLNQRGIIETVFGHLKHHYQVWHTRHRSVVNAMTHLVAALAAYANDPLSMTAIKRLQQMT